MHMVTGECENIRLGIQAARYTRMVFLKEKSLLSINLIRNQFDPFILIGNQKNNPGCIIVDQYVTNIEYGLTCSSNYFENCFMPSVDKVEHIYKFCSNESNKSKMLHEVVNSVIENDETQFLALYSEMEK